MGKEGWVARGCSGFESEIHFSFLLFLRKKTFWCARFLKLQKSYAAKIFGAYHFLSFRKVAQEKFYAHPSEKLRRKSFLCAWFGNSAWGLRKKG